MKTGYFRLTVTIFAAFAAGGAAWLQAQPPRQRVFVYAQDATQKRAVMAIIGEPDIRHEYASAGNELIFSAELVPGQVRAVERLGARVEAVPEIFPVGRKPRAGHLREAAVTLGKPVCGNGVCEGNESKTCPQDCAAPPPPGGRTCAPADQFEYQTLLLSGDSVGGGGKNLLVIDTGVNKDHQDLNVDFCRDTTGRNVRNRCHDELGHGTHVAGSAAAWGGADGMGLRGTATGATLGVIKICTRQCWLDDLIKGIEYGSSAFQPHVISLSFGAADIPALKNAVDAAVAGGALFIAAAGNSGPDADTISYPAAYANVVAVGMLDAARIASRMSSRGIKDGNDSTIAEREVEFAGGGFVIESTSSDGCYEIMSGTSMATPSVAGFAAAKWQGSAAATRTFLRNNKTDINNATRIPGYDDTVSGFDTSTGYGMPRLNATQGSISASVSSVPPTVGQGDTVDITVNGRKNSLYRIGITSPSGDWTYGEFTTDSGGQSALTLTPWTDPGKWLITVDFGGGATANFGAAFSTFVQH